MLKANTHKHIKQKLLQYFNAPSACLSEQSSSVHFSVHYYVVQSFVGNIHFTSMYILSQLILGTVNSNKTLHLPPNATLRSFFLTYYLNGVINSA